MPSMMGEYEWTRPKPWKLDWVLRTGEEVVAGLSSPSFFGTTMRGSFDGKDFVLRKGGLRRPGAAIREMGGVDDLLVLSFDALGKGTVARGGVPDYRWERPDQGETWYLMGKGDGVLLTVQRDVKGRQPRGKVDIRSFDPYIGPLLLLTWFMISTADP